MSPLPGTWTNYGSASLRVWFSDPDGVSVPSIRMDVDGLSLSVSPSGSGTVVEAYTYGPRIADGPHTANASASDQLGNGPTVLSWTFSVDTTFPVVTITSPSGNPLLPDGSVTLAWTGSDAVSGIDHYEVRLDDGPPFTVGTATTFPFHNLTPGVHYFWVVAYDLAGNYNYYTGEAVTIATVPAPPPPSGPQGNTTTQVTVVVPEQIPAWATALVVINAVEAAAIAWVALRGRRASSGGKAPAS